MSNYTPDQGCPKCGGQSGYSFTMTECHMMGGAWGGMATSGDNGDQRYSLVSCDDCGHKFRMEKLASLGAISEGGAAGVQFFA